MSRVGKAPIKIQPGVKVSQQSGRILVEGPKGKLNSGVPQGIKLSISGEEIKVERVDAADSQSGSNHGTVRTMIHNMVVGVKEGFTKDLDINGVGYRAAVKGQVLTMTLGYSHPVEYTLPAGITAAVENNTHIKVTGADKILVGMVAAKIRSFKGPEPYQGKGIKYTEERIVRKQGKAAGAK